MYPWQDLARCLGAAPAAAWEGAGAAPAANSSPGHSVRAVLLGLVVHHDRVLYTKPTKVERSEGVALLRTLFLLKSSSGFQFLDGFGTGSPGGNRKMCLKLMLTSNIYDITHWHFSPVVFLSSKHTKAAKRRGSQCVLTLGKPQVKSANALYHKYRSLA